MVLKPASLIIRTHFEQRAYDRARADGHDERAGARGRLVFSEGAVPELSRGQLVFSQMAMMSALVQGAISVTVVAT